MAKTLLNCVNEVLKRVGTIHGDAAALTSLTNSARQRSIDVAVQVINEGIDELYTVGDEQLPSGQASSTITLVTGTRAYALASDLVRLIWPLVDKTNTQFIDEYAGGYNDLLLLDPEQDDTGLPTVGAIRPTDGYLHLDRDPTSNENGRVYTYQYIKELVLSSASDTVPFGNIVFRAMVPAWALLWRREMENSFDTAMFNTSIGRAARLLNREMPNDCYLPRR